MLAPLGVLQRRGVTVRQVPLSEVADAAGPRTRLIAVSHVSWMRGSVAPVRELMATGVPVLLDGAQGLGAIPVDVRALGCDFYAAAGQKWLCGPDATGVLYVRRERIEALGIPWPSYVSLSDPSQPLELSPALGARRFDGGEAAGPLVAAALASLDVLEEAGWDWVFETARRQAQKLRQLLVRKGRAPGQRGYDARDLAAGRRSSTTRPPSSWSSASRPKTSSCAPSRGTPWLRASVGAWNSDADLERLAILI